MDSYNNRGRCPGVMCSITTCTLVNTAQGAHQCYSGRRVNSPAFLDVDDCWPDDNYGSTQSCSNMNFRILCWLSAILVCRCRVHVGQKQKRPWVNCLQNMEMWPQSGMSMISFYKYHTIWPADKLTQIPFFPPHFICSPSGLGSPAAARDLYDKWTSQQSGCKLRFVGKCVIRFR